MKINGNKQRVNSASGIPQTTLDQSGLRYQSVSNAMKNRSEDGVSEEEEDTSDRLHDNDPLSSAQTGHPSDLVASGNESQADAERDITTSEAGNTQEKDLGEEDIVGGSTPVTGVGSDVGDMAKQVGLDYDTDNDGDGYENDELNIAAKIDQAEKALREN